MDIIVWPDIPHFDHSISTHLGFCSAVVHEKGFACINAAGRLFFDVARSAEAVDIV